MEELKQARLPFSCIKCNALFSQPLERRRGFRLVPPPGGPGEAQSHRDSFGTGAASAWQNPQLCVCRPGKAGMFLVGDAGQAGGLRTITCSPTVTFVWGFSCLSSPLFQVRGLVVSRRVGTQGKNAPF